MKTNGKKLRASLLAGVLAIAMVLTGTLAWRSMSQRAINKFMEIRNPGGRVHDDFKGLEDKDVYAENFTDAIDGAPVFARIKLLEYMETGEDAGINLNVKDRKVTPVLWGDRTYVSVNDTSTWKVFDPTDPDDPFRKHWDWTFGGSTAYLPTFNKNKDSLSVDVNGTYEGKNKLFDDIDPYSDYVVYTLGQEKTGDAYYDADPDDKDEYKVGVSIAPGAGGTEGTNFTKKSEKHTVQSTLNSLGIMTLSQWKAAGSPVCNRWIYDDSENSGGWFYWPEPIQPQTATGLLLNKVDLRKSASERSYYAIEVVGQFSNGAGGSEGDKWGDSSIADNTDPKKGFYADGFSMDAKALLDQAASVAVDKDGRWYLPQGNGVYKEILDDTGKLGELVCAGADEIIGTDDDRTDVVAVEGGFNIGGTEYCGFYLKPTAAEPYYRAAAPTGKLGTETDTFFWPIGGAAFPSEDVTTDPVTSVTVTETSGATQVKNGGTLNFTATVETDLADKSVVWSVSDNKSAETVISEDGVLTVKGEAENTTTLTITATSRLDGRKSGSMTVDVVSERASIAISGPTQVHAASSVELTPTVTVEGTPVTGPDVTWTAVDEHGAAIIGVRISANADKKGELTVADDESLAGSTIYVTATYAPAGKPPVSATYEVEVLEKITANVTLTPAAAVSGGKVDAGATVSAPFALTVTDNQNAPMSGYSTVWSVTAQEPVSTFAVRAIDSGSKVTIDKNTGALSVGRRVPAGTEITVTCTVSYTAEGKERTASNSATLTVRGPGSVEVIAPATKVMQGSDVVMKAQLKKSDGSAYPSDQVFWELSGATKAGTTIDEDTGVLTLAKDEPLKVLTITATSLVDTEKKATKTVTVVPDWTKDTVTLNNIEFYILYRDTANNRALLLSKYALGPLRMDSTKTTRWPNTELYEYLNKTTSGGWLYGKNEIQELAKDTTLKTRVDNQEDQWDTTTSKIFLLSQADIYGTQYTSSSNDAAAKSNDYTIANTKLDASKAGGSWATTTSKGAAAICWLRSPRSATGIAAANVNVDGTLSADNRTYPYHFRPALWVRTS